MSDARTTAVLRARELTTKAAQWLVLLRHRSHPGAPEFSVWISTYHDMLDPAATDELRLGACRRMREAVRRSAEVERLAERGIRADSQTPDPYGACPHLTLRGATLEMIVSMLEEAIHNFVSGGVSVDF